MVDRVVFGQIRLAIRLIVLVELFKRLDLQLGLILGDAVHLLIFPASWSRLPAMVSRLSSVSLPHFSFTCP